MQYSKQAKTHILSEIAFEVKSARKWKTKEQANSIVIAIWYQLWSFKQPTTKTTFFGLSTIPKPKPKISDTENGPRNLQDKMEM